MLVDEITIKAKAGKGGDGVVRFQSSKFKPKGGPSGGNGGNGGSIYLRAVSDQSRLSKYTGSKEFKAPDGQDGRAQGQHGKNADDLYIDIPTGSRVTDTKHDRVVELTKTGQEVCILKGGKGGLGNEHFKSSTNQAPQKATKGKSGEEAELHIELMLIADIGLVGLPNAGKSTLLNKLTNSKSNIGNYPFTTLEPHLGVLGKYVIADIPGLIEGANQGKGLGHKFLKHLARTKVLLQVLSLDSENPKNDYYTILEELSNYDKEFLNKEKFLVLTKKDLVNQGKIKDIITSIDIDENRVFVTSENDPDSIKNLANALVSHLEEG